MENSNKVVIPRMRTIQQVAESTGFSYRHIMSLCKENRIIYVKAGAKYLVNLDRFIEYLNNGDTEQ